MEWLQKLLLDIGSAAFESLLEGGRARRKRINDLRPTINRITIRLWELADHIDELWKRQWEMSYRDFEPARSPDRLEELAEEAAVVSVAAGRVARELLRNLNRFESAMQSQLEMAQEQVRDELWERPIEPEEAIDEIFLIENRRYHLWQQHLYNIEDHIGRLARTLSEHADTGARSFLESLQRRGRVERIADQSFDAVLAGFERGSRRAHWWERGMLKWKLRRGMRRKFKSGEGRSRP